MGNISIRSFVAAVTVYIILISDEVLSSCSPKCDIEHCCVYGKCQKRLEPGQSCNPVDIKNGNVCPCRIGYVCIQDNNEHKCHDHSETSTASSFEGHGRPCWPKCDLEHCCVNGECQSRLSEGQSCNPTDIHSGHACPCRIGFVCTEENSEFRCKNHLQAGTSASAAAHSESTTSPRTTLKPTTAPPSTTTVSHTTTTSTPITTTTTTTTTPRPTTTPTPTPTTSTTTPPTSTTTLPTSTTTPTPFIFTSPSISRNVPHSTPSFTTPSFSTPSLKDSTTPRFRLPGSTAHNPEPYSPTESDPWGTSGHPTSRQPPYNRQTRPPHRPFNNGSRT